MDQESLKLLLQNLLSHEEEREWVEFKTASTHMDIDELGKYFSALSNEANLKNKPRGWLILGVTNARQIVGTTFRNTIAGLNELKKTIAMGTGGVSFIEIHPHYSEQGARVLLFEIAPSLQAVPTNWKGVAYGREGESLEILNDVKKSLILSQDRNDWSGRKCEGSNILDLDVEAINFLRLKLCETTSQEEYLIYSDAELLNRLGLTIDNIPVNAALILLGKTDPVNRLMPDKAKISWKYIDEENEITERVTFEAPLINKFQAVIGVVNRFNFNIKEASLFRRDIKQYDELALRELLVNAIAHRDWSIDLWVEIKQSPSEISFKNPGNFRADIIAAVKKNERPPYLNKKLADILQKIKLMEREGGGLRKVYRSQLERGTGVTYNFSNSTQHPSVEFILRGRVDDIEFAKLLVNRKSDIEISDVIWLDQIRGGSNKVGLDISKDIANELKSKGYIEIRGGRSQKAFISAELARVVGKETEYTTSKSLPRDAKTSVVLKHIEKFGKINVAQATKIFSAEPPPTVRGLLSQLAKEGIIRRVAPAANKSTWFYIANNKEESKQPIRKNRFWKPKRGK